MSVETVVLPSVWGRYVRLYGEANEIRLGSRAFSSPFPHNGLYYSWIKFDTSQLTALRLTVAKVVSALIRIYVTGCFGTVPDVAVHRVIKNATSALTYYKYDGTNDWSEAGGKGLGTDIIATPINTHTFVSGVVENNIVLSAADLFDIHTSNRPIYLQTPSSFINNDTYIVTAWSNASIVVNYKVFGLSGDATMF